MCDMGQALAEPRCLSRLALSFFAVVVCETVAAIKVVDEQLVSMLLPYILAGLKRSAVDDHRLASFMIVTELARRVTMGEDLAGGAHRLPLVKPPACMYVVAICICDGAMCCQNLLRL